MQSEDACKCDFHTCCFCCCEIFFLNQVVMHVDICNVLFDAHKNIMPPVFLSKKRDSPEKCILHIYNIYILFVHFYFFYAF